MSKNGLFSIGFLKPIITLSSGTVIAQLIGVLVSPIITRLFEPEELGELGYFIRILGVIVAIGTLRYELSLPLAKSDHHAFQLFRLSLKIAAAILLASLFGGLVYWAVDGFDSQLLLYLLALIIACAFSIFRNIGQSWAIRLGHFKTISASRLIGSASLNGFRIIAGLSNLGTTGLILATSLGILISPILYFKEFNFRKTKKGYSSSKAKQRVLLKEYSEFPKVNLAHALVDNLRELALAYLILEIFDTAFFGLYDHAFKILRMPLIVIGTAVGQALFQKLSQLKNSGELMFPELRRTLIFLSLLSIIPFSINFLYGAEIFKFVFGDEWEMSGKIAEALTPWIMVHFIASPVSTLPLVIRRQKEFFILGSINSIILLASFLIIPELLLSGDALPLLTFQYVSWIMAALGIFIIYLSIYYVRKADAAVEGFD